MEVPRCCPTCQIAVKRISELLGINAEYVSVSRSIKTLECQEALGMESGAIFDGQISASSEWNDSESAVRSRLHLEKDGDKPGGWAAGTSNGEQWL